jgi:hypothetical protein
MFQRLLRAFVGFLAASAVDFALVLVGRLILIPLGVDATTFSASMAGQLSSSSITLVGSAVAGYVIARLKPADATAPALILGSVIVVLSSASAALSSAPYGPIRVAFALAGLLIIWLVARNTAAGLTSAST